MKAIEIKRSVVLGIERSGKQMEIKILATGSSGNSVLIDKHILVDAGITTKAFSSHGIEPGDLSAFIITHKHGDHMKTPLVRYLLKNGVKALLPTDAIAELIKENMIDMGNLIDSGQVTPLKDNTVYTVGSVQVQAYPQDHYDIVNYALVLEKGAERVLYSTDLDTVEPTEKGVGLLHLGQFDTILLEGNYDEPYLRSYIEYMISLVPDADDPKNFDDQDLEKWVKSNYRSLPEDIARNAFRAIQNHRHLSKQQARAYAMTHLKPSGTYYEIHRSSQFYEEPEGWMKD